MIKSTALYLVLLCFLISFSSLEAAAQKFAAIGDFGMYRPQSAEVARLVKSWDPEFIISLGDNNYPEGEAETIDLNVGSRYARYIYPYKGKFGKGAEENRFFPVLGNHDVGEDSPQAYYDYFELPNNERYYDFVKGDIHFFAMNSNWDEADGITGSSAQAMWLKERILASESIWNIVYFHHPPYSSGPHGNSTWMQWPLKEWGADLIMSGHDHIYEHLYVDGLHCLINGLGGGAIYELDSSEFHPASWLRYNGDHGALKVDASAKKLKIQFVNVNENVIDEFEIVKTKPGPESLFDSEEVLELELRTDLDELTREYISEDDEELDLAPEEIEALNKKRQNASVSYIDTDGKRVSFQLEIRPRGSSRREVCDFPPLQFRFRGTHPSEIGLFNGQDNIKLVTHCWDERAQGEDGLLKEYLVYKWYSDLDPKGFRVRLARITYVDNNGQADPIVKLAFFLEDNDRLGERIGAVKMDISESDPRPEFPPPVFLSLFQMMVGNNDWYTPDHNMKPFITVDKESIFVPYDFDLSYVCHADMEEQPPRRYKGVCRSAEELKPDIRVYADAREQILGRLDKFDLLTAQDREPIKKYLDQFFVLIEDMPALYKTVSASCATVHE